MRTKLVSKIVDGALVVERINFTAEENTEADEREANELSLMKDSLRKLIDMKAGEIRKLLVSDGAFIEEEYRRAKEEALQFQAAGYPSANIPAAIQIDIDLESVSKEVAADSIIAKSNEFNQVLDQIRIARKTAKKSIDLAVTEAEINLAYDTGISDLKAINIQVKGS